MSGLSRRCFKIGTYVVGLILVGGGFVQAHDDEGAELQRNTFETYIRPILVEHCYSCHSAQSGKSQAGLRLDSRKDLMAGGDVRPVIEPGEIEASLLIEAIRYEGPIQMPPSGKLADEVIVHFEAWVESGAYYPDDQADAEAAADRQGMDPRTDESERPWAFRTPQLQELPELSKGPASTRIDAFIEQHLEAFELEPNPEADRRTLIRRLSFDLTGLPPTPEQVESFVNDESANAYASLVDRLLNSLQFGERWARMWLDVARYAEDQAHIVGNNKSLFYPNAYLYRDWVIQAFNEDLPIDEFFTMQLAADLADAQSDEHLAALGFIGLGPKYYRRGTREVMADEWEDRVDVVSRGLLGMTVACARCHDHKFDPIPTEDYYALAGVFASSPMFNRPLKDDCEINKVGEAKEPTDAMHIIREGQPQDLPIYIRGDVTRPGSVARRHFLTVLGDQGPTPLGDDQRSGRLDLAKAITDPDNPLTSRVFINRVWQHLFGRAIVGTPSNFGLLGEPPTHPELLDDLSARFVTEGGWSFKWLIREIVTTDAYRRSSAITEEQQALDPDNTLLARMNGKRLSIEAWRDAMLAATGRLDRSIGGDSIDPADPNSTRRTLYGRISRLELNPLLARFDFPDPNAHAASRSQTTTPLQKLFIMNSPFMINAAQAFGERCRTEAGEDSSTQLTLAYRLLYGRDPDADEVRIAKSFLGDQPSDDRWSTLAQALMAANEFLWID